MGNARLGISPTDIGYPFPENRCIDQSVDPHRTTDCWTLERDATDLVSRDHGHLACSEHLHRVVGTPEQRVLQINHLALHVDGDDLAASMSNDLAPDSKTGKQQARVASATVLPDNGVSLR